MRQVANILSNIFIIAGSFFIAWFLVSWADIIIDNASANPEHYDWNLFVFLLENYKPQ